MRPPVADVHVHVIPPGAVDQLRRGTAPLAARVRAAGGGDVVEHAEGYWYPLAAEFWDAAALIGSRSAPTRPSTWLALVSTGSCTTWA